MDGARASLFFRRQVGELIDEVLFDASDEAVTLVADLDERRATFSVQPASGEAFTLGNIDLRYLSSEVAGGFTGVFIGLFAVGAGLTLRCSQFDYQPVWSRPDATGAGSGRHQASRERATHP